MSIFNYIFGKKKESEHIHQSHNKPCLYVPDFNQYDEFGQIVSIFDYVLNPDFTIANKAAQTVHRLFETVKDFKNKQLYETFRYLSINKSEIKKFNQFETEIKITLLCIASMNGNGYSGEAALNWLIDQHSKRTIPFILFRLADWVAPIRQKAEEAIRSLIVEDNTIYFIQNHKLISWLLHIERNDLSELHNQIINSIATKRIDSEQLQKLNDSDRLFYFKSLINIGELDNNLVKQMQTDKYYLIRLLLVMHLDKIENVKSILTKLLSDKSQKVRQGAINMLANQNLKDYLPILETLIFDNSTSVRVEARRLVSKICDWDFRKKYQESLSKNQFIVGSILGLSEVSDRNDIPIIQKYLESDNAKIRTASLYGIYNLDSNLGVEKAYQILETENPVSTKKTAETILAKQGIDFKRLRKLYDTTDTIGKQIILQLFNKFSGWSVAGDFLKALTGNDKKIQLMARIFLDSWDRYTVRLATRKSQEDKEYVLNWYDIAKEKGIEVPENIPFIFREK